MSNLNEVLEFIKNSNRKDLKIIIEKIRARQSEIKSTKKAEFNIGDVVGIDYKTVSPEDQFKVVRINIKNITVEKMNIPNGHVAGQFRVSPNLLIKK